jgi:hypothetical protein
MRLPVTVLVERFAAGDPKTAGQPAVFLCPVGFVA